MQAGLWRVENVPQQLFPDWGFRLIKDSKIVVRREYGPYSTYCVSVEFIDLIFFFLTQKASLLFLKLCHISLVGVYGHLPHSFQIVRVASKQSLANSRRSQRVTLGQPCLAAGTDNSLLQFIYHDLALQVPDLDAGPVAAEPVSVGAEAGGADDVHTI